VLFYAEHGLQVAGESYLVPVDAKAEDGAADLRQHVLPSLHYSLSE
jgi:uncharacterized caspase-like protein